MPKILSDEQKQKRREYHRAYYAEHGEIMRARSRAWYRANKERHAQGRKARYDSEATKEYNKLYRQKHADRLKIYNADREKTEKRKEQCRKWRQKNSAKIMARVTAWQKNNPTRVKMLARDKEGRRRARLKNRPFERVDPMLVYQIELGICGLCGCPVGVDEFELDHIVPIAKGGAHLYSNLHIAHKKCNLAKSARTDAIIYSV